MGALCGDLRTRARCRGNAARMRTEALAGGNSAFTAGLMRTVYRGIDDLKAVIPELTTEQIDEADFGTYPAEKFLGDLARVTRVSMRPRTLAESPSCKEPRDARCCWMRQSGCASLPPMRRQAFKIDGKFVFWGGAIIEIVGGGPGLIESLTAEAERIGVTIHYEDIRPLAHYRRLRCARGQRADRQASRPILRPTPSCSQREELPGVRRVADPLFATGMGSRQGPGGPASAPAPGIRMGVRGRVPRPQRNWSGCHAVGWDLNAPEFGDLAGRGRIPKAQLSLRDHGQRRGQALCRRRRGLPELHLCRKYGRAVLNQPHQLAWRVFDAKADPAVARRSRIRQVTKVSANTLEELAAKLEGSTPRASSKRWRHSNAAVQVDIAFNPNVLDGRKVEGMAVPKSNWCEPARHPAVRGVCDDVRHHLHLRWPAHRDDRSTGA